MSADLTRRLHAGQTWDDEERGLAVACARRLQRAASTGPASRPLQGCHLALVVRDDDRTGVAAFERAALALGATLSYLPAAQFLPEAGRSGATARLLERLYHGVDATLLGAAEAAQLQSQVQVPVFVGFEDPAQPLGALTDSLCAGMEAGSAAHGRDFVVQAVLLQACS